MTADALTGEELAVLVRYDLLSGARRCQHGVFHGYIIESIDAEKRVNDTFNAEYTITVHALRMGTNERVVGSANGGDKSRALMSDLRRRGVLVESTPERRHETNEEFTARWRAKQQAARTAASRAGKRSTPEDKPTTLAEVFGREADKRARELFGLGEPAPVRTVDAGTQVDEIRRTEWAKSVTLTDMSWLAARLSDWSIPHLAGNESAAHAAERLLDRICYEYPALGATALKADSNGPRVLNMVHGSITIETADLLGLVQAAREFNLQLEDPKGYPRTVNELRMALISQFDARKAVLSSSREKA